MRGQKHGRKGGPQEGAFKEKVGAVLFEELTCPWLLLPAVQRTQPGAYGATQPSPSRQPVRTYAEKHSDWHATRHQRQGRLRWPSCGDRATDTIESAVCVRTYQLRRWQLDKLGHVEATTFAQPEALRPAGISCPPPGELMLRFHAACPHPLCNCRSHTAHGTRTQPSVS